LIYAILGVNGRLLPFASKRSVVDRGRCSGHATPENCPNAFSSAFASMSLVSHMHPSVGAVGADSYTGKGLFDMFRGLEKNYSISVFHWEGTT